MNRKFYNVLLVLSLIASVLYVALGGPVDKMHLLAYLLVNAGVVLIAIATFKLVQSRKSERPADVL